MECMECFVLFKWILQYVVYFKHIVRDEQELKCWHYVSSDYERNAYAQPKWTILLIHFSKIF